MRKIKSKLFNKIVIRRYGKMSVSLVFFNLPTMFWCSLRNWAIWFISAFNAILTTVWRNYFIWITDERTPLIEFVFQHNVRIGNRKVFLLTHKAFLQAQRWY